MGIHYRLTALKFSLEDDW